MCELAKVKKYVANALMGMTWCLVLPCAIAFVFIVGAMQANEEDAVCSRRLMTIGKDITIPLDCDNPNGGPAKFPLALASCKLDTSGFHELEAPAPFNSMIHIGTGLSTVTEMMQCIEHQHQSTVSAVGSEKQTVTTYTYTAEWTTTEIDSSNFIMKSSEDFLQNCGVENPRWGDDIPRTAEVYAPSIRFGNLITTEKKFIAAIPLDTLVEWRDPLPENWTYQPASGVYETQAGPANPNGIGMVRTRFLSNNWTNEAVTVLGNLTTWNGSQAINIWEGLPCHWIAGGVSGGTYSQGRWREEAMDVGILAIGTLNKDEIFEMLDEGDHLDPWPERKLWFGVLWFIYADLSVFVAVKALFWARCLTCLCPPEESDANSDATAEAVTQRSVEEKVPSLRFILGCFVYMVVEGFLWSLGTTMIVVGDEWKDVSSWGRDVHKGGQIMLIVLAALYGLPLLVELCYIVYKRCKHCLACVRRSTATE